MTRPQLLILALALAWAAPGCKSAPDPVGSTLADGASGEPADLGEAAGSTSPAASALPKATGACPTFARGRLTFAPDGKARDAEVWIGDAAQALDGPLLFFWHGAGGSPQEATYVLGAALDEILDAGGVVVAPYHDPAAGQLPWFLALGGGNEADLRVADEALACAIASVGVDTRRVHSMGFSAGAMHTAQFVERRSGYLASVVMYSGALLGQPTRQEPGNLYPALLFHGGPTDKVILQFDQEMKKLHDRFVQSGQFSLLCGHGRGHTVPTGARGGAWRFLADHPFGERPEPYATTLPPEIPAYCAR